MQAPICESEELQAWLGSFLNTRDLISPGDLRRIQGFIRQFHELDGSLSSSWYANRDSEANGLHPVGTCRVRHREICNRLPDFFRNLSNMLLRGIRQDYSELLAADTCSDAMSCLHDLCEDASNRAQADISTKMTNAVIVLLKLVG